MNIDEMISELDLALNMLAPIAVSHAAVDMMAAAKHRIRAVKSELQKQNKDNKEEKSDG